MASRGLASETEEGLRCREDVRVVFYGWLGGVLRIQAAETVFLHFSTGFDRSFSTDNTAVDRRGC